MKAKLIVAVGLVAIAAGAGFALLTRHSSAPDVRFVTLAGQNFTTAELRGKVVLVNFWATSGTVANGFGGVRGTPTTFLLDKRGRIVKQYLGEPDWAEFHALVERALAEPA